MSETVSVVRTISVEVWSDLTVTVKCVPGGDVPADVFFNAAATIIRMIIDKSGRPIDNVMDHVREHVDAAKRLPKPQ